MGIFRETVDQTPISDVNSLGWMAVEMSGHPEMLAYVINRISREIESLPVGPPFDMSCILEGLVDEGHSEAAVIYAKKIRNSVHDLEFDEYWDSIPLVTCLISSLDPEGIEAGVSVAREILSRCEMDAGETASFLAVLGDVDPRLAEEAASRLDGLLEEVDVTDLISLHPLVLNLARTGRTSASLDLLSRMAESMDSVVLSRSYAPFEMIHTLRQFGFEEAANSLCKKSADEFEPGISGAAAHVLGLASELFPREILTDFARRLSGSGPILPLEDSRKLIECFEGLDLMRDAEAYRTRVQKFKLEQGI